MRALSATLRPPEHRQAAGVLFGILGPIEASRDHQPLHVGGPREKKLLAALLLAANRAVTTDHLTTVLWDEQPPVTSRAQLHNSVAALRRNLDVVISSRDGGYSLRLAPGGLDASTFEQEVRRAEELAVERPADAVELLRHAASLRRGPSLSGVDSRALAGEALRLDEQWLACQERRFDLDLSLGRHAALIGDISTMVADHPLRERLHAQLMLALYRAGRQADALRCFRYARELLADELGIEPGAELVALERAILCGDPSLQLTPTESITVSAPLRPSQLPADSSAFTGRAGQLRQLDEALASDHHIVITGMAGVGKTALAVHWANRISDRFPDGTLHADLGTHADVLPRFLRALGMPSSQIPQDTEEQAAAYRSLLTGRRVLVLLDNALDSAAVRTLLPPKGSRALITSRSRLDGLVALEGARVLPLKVFTHDESHRLMTTLLGQSRVGADPAATGELIELCCRLPLALRIAAANVLTQRHESVAALTADMAGGNRLDVLGTADTPRATLRGVLDQTVRTLSGETTALFGKLGFLSPQGFSTAAAAALAGFPVSKARTLVDRLADVHLVERVTQDRYVLNELVRLYARETAGVEDSAPMAVG